MCESQTKEVSELQATLAKQNSLIESLEKELNNLKLSEDENDPNAELVKKLTNEQEKLKYRINILKGSIENAKNCPVTASEIIILIS
jgi:predicted RNase H-like nuclease (RuvC/YqgF family)